MNECPSIFPIVAPEKRFGKVDAAPGMSGGSETNELGLVLLSDAVDIGSSLVVTVLVVDFTCMEWLSAGEARMQICRIQTLAILMATELSHIISRNICIWKTANGVLFNCMVCHIPLQFRSFRRYLQELSHIILSKWSINIPH